MSEQQLTLALASLKDYRDALDAAVKAIERVIHVRRQTGKLVIWPREDTSPDAA